MPPNVDIFTEHHSPPFCRLWTFQDNVHTMANHGRNDACHGRKKYNSSSGSMPPIKSPSEYVSYSRAKNGNDNETGVADFAADFAL